MGSRMSNKRLWAVIICVWYHDHENGLVGDVTSENHSWMNTITKGNLWHYHRSTPVVPEISYQAIMVSWRQNWRQAWPEEPIMKSSHCPRQCNEPSSSSNPQLDITSKEHLKIVSTILSTIQNYFPILSPRIRNVWVCGHQHILSMHTQGLSQLSAISLYTTKSGV